MLIIPLQAQPTQTLNISLNGQATTLNVYAAGDDPDSGNPRIYVDLYVANTLVLGGVFANIGARMVRDAYLGFVGDIVLNDTQPDPDLGPQQALWKGLGARWLLLYLYPAELTGDV
jgi:hypothetical protein